MAKLNYDKFASFDLNEACDHFDCTDQKAWNKIRPFIVADGEEFTEVMLKDFEFDEVVDGEYRAFEAGVKYALSKMNRAFERAGIDVQVCEVDLVESTGFMLVRCDDEPEDFVKRVLKKPVMMVDSWV
jgi:hypothetical protein